MSTSVFFNNFSNNPEQNLIEDLVIESIKIYGHDVMYCPRTLVAKDEIYGEDSLSQYKIAYDIDMYIRSYDSYEGDGQFLSKFNLEIRDQMTLTVSVRNFMNEVGSLEGITRPREGDLIYIPMVDRIMVIKYVNKTPIFYQMGALQMYDLVCELFEYSNEIFNTGVEQIDNTYNAFLTTIDPYILLTENGQPLFTEDGFSIISEDYNVDYLDETSQNNIFEAEGNLFLDFTERDPFSESDRRA